RFGPGPRFRFCTAEGLWKLLQPKAPAPAASASSGPTGSVRAPDPFRLVELRRLASTLRSLGFDGDCDETKKEVLVASGPDKVRVHVDEAEYVVEHTREGANSTTKTVPIAGKDSEDRLRALVLEKLGFGKPA